MTIFEVFEEESGIVAATVVAADTGSVSASEGYGIRIAEKEDGENE